MKKLAVAGLIAVGITLMGTLPSDADGRRHFRGHHGGVHARFFVGFGPGYYWGPGPYYPYWYYPPPPYAVYTPPPVVVQRSEPVYMQQMPPVAAVPEQQFWYYCQSAGGYYPTVPSCSEEWVKVPPR